MLRRRRCVPRLLHLFPRILKPAPELLGREAQAAGGVFLVAIALAQRFGDHRVFNLAQHYVQPFAVPHARREIDLGRDAMLREVREQYRSDAAPPQPHR